jgi:hypothetical protein
MGIDSVLSAMSFNRTDSVTIEGWKELKKISDSVIEIEQYVNVQNTAIRQVITLEITVGSTGDIYSVGIQNNGSYYNFAYVQQSTDHQHQIAQGLADAIDKSSLVEAIAGGHSVTIIAYVAGQSFTVTNDQSTVPANLVITEAVAAEDNGNVVLLLSKTRLTYSTNTEGKPQIETEIEWYFNDDLTPVTTSNRGIAIHPNSLGELQNAAL